MNAVLAQHAKSRLLRGAPPKAPGYCQAWVRRTVQDLYGARYDRWWRGSARATALAFLADPPVGAQVIPSSDVADTQVGDLLYRRNKPFGHVSIRVYGNLVAENSTAHVKLGHPSALGFRPLAKVKFDLIVRLPETL